MIPSKRWSTASRASKYDIPFDGKYQIDNWQNGRNDAIERLIQAQLADLG